MRIPKPRIPYSSIKQEFPGFLNPPDYLTRGETESPQQFFILEEDYASCQRGMNCIAPWKGIHDSLGFWIPPCGFRIPSTGFRIPAQWIPDSKKGWIPIFFFFKCFSSHFVFVFESCYIERRCLECISSLFSFSIYKLREEMLYCSGLRYD